MLELKMIVAEAFEKSRGPQRAGVEELKAEGSKLKVGDSGGQVGVPSAVVGIGVGHVAINTPDVRA
jgi:hypothetical protein